MARLWCDIIYQLYISGDMMGQRYVLAVDNLTTRLAQVVEFHLEEILRMGFYDSRKDRAIIHDFAEVIIENLVLDIMNPLPEPYPGHRVGSGIYAELHALGIGKQLDVSIFEVIGMVVELVETEVYDELKRKVRALQRRFDILSYEPDRIELTRTGAVNLYYK